MLQQFYPQVFHDYRYELNKDMNLAAAHFIPDAEAGVCQQMHGHTYFINVTIVGDELDRTGFLVNFKTLKEEIHKRYDHSLLNDHEAFAGDQPDTIPTTEVVAAQIWQQVDALLAERPNRPYCLQVLVRETPTSYVTYRPKKEDHR
ncbi:preQ(0) biosynthesis protein QueD [Salsuginibacillus halophilus]|uniref:6-carboxy-5,6,7,8-tetrahydropterin synthase n=1 Tax=Salsuginibacillus halophilus TaxID=517424 RepID=A0A2P8HLC0_9BACI|nr:6-carboxytetrahydropterin synthase QueD [Salsuginibacillus halophilus]PSL47015.1 preQ(0) biosynthesis protein QueD [Salsuginibacillus halophilus]